MQDLHLVGFTKDRRHLIFSTRKGAKSGSFLVPVDEDLIDAVDEVASYVADQGSGSEPPDESPVEERAPRQPRIESSLSVKEVQTRLRAGEPVEAVATDAGVDPAWVERFAAPVRAEQRRIVERAMVAHLQRPRAGRSAVSLRRAITAAMAERKIHMSAEQFEAAWHSHVESPGRWVVGFTFPTRGKSRTLTWDFDVASGRLTTSDRFASQLGFRSADDLPSENSTVDDGSTAGGRRSGGLAIPGTTKGSPVSEANLPRRPSPPVMPRRPTPPPTASAMPPRRPSVPTSPPVTPRDTDGLPPRVGPEPPARAEPTDARRPTTDRGPTAPPRPPERAQEPGEGGTPVETQRPARPPERRPEPVRPDPPIDRRPDTSRPTGPLRPTPPEAVPGPAASMAPKAPAPERHPRRDLDLPPPVRRPAPVATDASRGVDEDDVEIAPSLRVISTEEDSSVRLIPAAPSDDVDGSEPEGVLDDEVENEHVSDEDDLAVDGLEEAPAEDDRDDADDEDDIDDIDETDDVEDLDDDGDDDDLAEHEADEAEDTEDTEDFDDFDDEDEPIEADDRDDDDDEPLELPEEPAAAVDSDVVESSVDETDDDADGDDVELEPVADRRSLGRVRFATDADRGRSTSAGDDEDSAVTDDQQSRDEDTAEKEPVGDTITWDEDEAEGLRLRPIDSDDLHPRRAARRPRRSQPIVARSEDPPSDESSPVGGTGPESTARRSSAQFKAGFAKVAGADARDGVEQPAQKSRRDPPPAPERASEAEESGPKGDIEWPEGGDPERGEARPQRRRQPSEKPQSTGKKPRRRRSQPLRAR